MWGILQRDEGAGGTGNTFKRVVRVDPEIEVTLLER